MSFSSLALVLGACTADRGPAGTMQVEGYVMDSVAVRLWDTLLEVRSAADDTTLIAPYQVTHWGQGVVVGDAIASRLTYFRLDGTLQWTVGRPGEGPEEFRAITDMFVAKDSTLWVLDSSNMRVARVSLGGVILGTQRLADIPPFPWGLLNLEDSLLVLANHKERTFSMVSRDGLAITGTRGFAWPDGVPDRASVSLRGAAAPGGTRWTAALQLGPGFVIHHRGGESAFDYVEPVPFAVEGPRARAVFGATAADATAEGPYFLFGGRPKRIPDMQGDPPRRIDQYSWDGDFIRRYLLPGGITDFSTDGLNFYVIQEEPVPALLVLTPSQVPR